MPAAEQQEGGYLAAFDRFYEEELKDWLRRQERRRVRAVAILAVGVVVVGVAGGLFWALAENLRDMMDWAFVIGVLALIGVAQPYARLRRDVKGFAASRIAAQFGLEYHLRPSGAVAGCCNLSPFRENRLIPSYDKSRLEDVFLGAHDGVDLTLFEARLLRETRGTNGRKGHTTVFRGLLATFSFHKPFQGRTLVLTDHGLLGNWLSGLGTGAKRVRLEDPRFEDVFEVYSTDQVEARYLLTPAFMERVLELGRVLGNAQVQLAFADNVLRLSVRSGRDWFEAGNMLWRPVADKERVRRIAQEIATIFEMVDVLKLNMATRV